MKSRIRYSSGLTRGLQASKGGVALLGVVSVLVGQFIFSAEPLPGPGIDLAVDLDGDGLSTYGDLYTLNQWLAGGGSLEDALLQSTTREGLIDLSDFFSSPEANLSTSQRSEAAGEGADCPHVAQAANKTRRIPPLANPDPNLPDSHIRTSSDGRFMVFTTAADLGFGSNQKRQVYLFKFNSGDRVAGNLTLVSRDRDEVPAAADCFRPAVSDDGNIIVFDTTAQLCPIEDTNTFSDIYVRDLRDTPVTRILSINPAGMAGNNFSRFPGVSSDGNVVVFASLATDLTADIGLGLENVYRIGSNGSSPPMLLVSRSDLAGDALANNHLSTTDPNLATVGDVVNATGDLILFQGAPSNWNFAQLPNNTFTQVFLRVLTNPASPRTFLVSASGSPGDGTSRRPSISKDGSRIAFSSNAPGFDPVANTTEDVFLVKVADLLAGTAAPQKIPNRDGGAPDGLSFLPMLSATGNRVAFASDATNYVLGDTNLLRDVFVTEVCNTDPVFWVTERFSVSSAGGQATGGNSTNPDLCGDGRVVVYESSASNLVPGDAPGTIDVFETLSPGGPFIRGDANADGMITNADSSAILNWLSLGFDPPACLDAADFFDNGIVEQSDASAINSFLFLGGAPPACPHPACGLDPTADTLNCGAPLLNCTGFCQ